MFHSRSWLRAAAGAVLTAMFAASCASSYAPVENGDSFVMSDSEKLQTILAARGDADRSRDKWRHPLATLEFVGLESDDFVVEVLPGQGWYTRILLPYVAEDGRYAAVNYQYDMFPLILPDPNKDLLAFLRAWPDTFPNQAAEETKTSAKITAFEFGAVPEEVLGQADAVVMIRALHNFNRAGGPFGDQAIGDVYAMLKPGGVLAVVQHRAPEGATGAAADGSNGYMSKENVIAMLEQAGFVFEAETEINANPKDRPGPGDVVWRLPPTYAFGDENRAAYSAIGETDRMTLRFRKPAQ